MRSALTGYLSVLLGGIIVAAQEPKATSETKVKSDNGTVVTLVGCVEIGGGTSFQLTNVTSERGKQNSKPSPAAVSYSLKEREGLDLGPYIQQKVELTGVVVPAATRGDKDDKIKVTDPANGDAKVKVTRGAQPQFLVASFKTLAPTCQP
jgi:hypothetical protein